MHRRVVADAVQRQQPDQRADQDQPATDAEQAGEHADDDAQQGEDPELVEHGLGLVPFVVGDGASYFGSAWPLEGPESLPAPLPPAGAGGAHRRVRAGFWFATASFNPPSLSSADADFPPPPPPDRT